MRRLTLISPVAALLMYGMATARPVHAAPGTNGQIAFTQQIDAEGNAKVFIANSDGSGVTAVPLADGAELFSGAIWSPSGRKLLISHTFRLDPSTGQCCLPFRPAIVNPDGSDYTLLAITDGPFDMNCGAWSLDQTRLFCAFGGQNPGVFSIRASDGGDVVQLTTNPYAATGGLDFPTGTSPDGTRVVFLRFKPDPAHPGPRQCDKQQVAIFVENIDGTGLQQITPYGLVAPNDRISAQWSPDGLKIISEMTNGQLFVVRTDGTGIKPIKLQTGTTNYFAFEPHWSPDGARIIFCMFINGGEGIYTANPDGSGLVQVTSTTNFATLYNWADWGRAPQ